ncbi:transposable element Tc3 transposase [Trichonephila clavipes]|nr:transposable element Tc3 transposase [Trichonephila clavipes]
MFTVSCIKSESNLLAHSQAKNHHPDEEPKPRVPDSIARPITNMPLSRMENTTFAMPSIIDSHDMGLRTVFTVRTPKRKRLFNYNWFYIFRSLCPTPEVLMLQSLVYADEPQTLDPLEDNIRIVIADIRPQMLEKVIENWTSRLDYIRASRGSPMPEIIFKIFVEWAQNEIAVVPHFHKRILFSDEAHFWLNGYVNKQNCRIWSEANPQVYVETPLHPEKLTVWCALWAGGIIGPYFFKNDEGHNVTVNGDRYRAMITNFFILELNNHDVQELWFQQDGATCHTARATIDLLKDTFGDRLISRFGPVNWPPRSCDLTPLDYFLWGYVKSLVYADKPQTLDHLEDNIRRVIADIRPQMLEKVIENWTFRLDYI